MHRLGCECEIWHDESKLGTGQNFATGLDNVTRVSTAFIAVQRR